MWFEFPPSSFCHIPFARGRHLVLSADLSAIVLTKAEALAKEE
jgi:tRNA A37 methylthiotransferase MiaB